MAKLFVIGVLFAGLSIITRPAFSEPTACQTLTIVGSDQWIPYAYIESDNQLYAKGIAFDVVRLISKDLGWSLNYKIGIPWRRIELLMDAGQVDLLAGNYWTEHRADKWAITNAFSQDEVRLFVSKGNEFQFLHLDDITDLNGLTPSGVSFGQTFDNFKHKLKLDEVATHQQMLAMLDLKRSDYIVLPYFNGLRKINQLAYGNKVIALKTPVSVNKVHLSLAKKSPCYSSDRLNQINEVIQKRLSDGSITRIENIYKQIH